MTSIPVLNSAWLPVFILMGITLFARRMQKSWFAPSVFAGMLWSLFLIIPLIATDYEVFPESIWAVVVLLVFMQAGSFLGESARYDRSTRSRDAKDLQDLALRLTLASGVASCLGVAYLVYWSFRNLEVPPFPVGFFYLGHEWSVLRYTEGFIEPWPARILLMWLYPASFMAGIVVATAESKRRKLCVVLPLVPALAASTVFGARASVLICCATILATYISVRICVSGNFQISRRVAIGILAAAAGTLAFFLGIDIVRGFRGQNVELAVDILRLQKYFLGYVAGFAHWFHYSSLDVSSMGASTLAGVFDLLRIQTRQFGIFSDVVVLNGGEITNIYTAFRGLIEDFTLAGAAVVCFISGYVAGRAFERCRTGHLGALVPLSAFYVFLFWSPIVSVFSYNGVLLAWFLGWIFLSERRFGFAPRATTRIPRPVSG